MEEKSEKSKKRFPVLFMSVTTIVLILLVILLYLFIIQSCQDPAGFQKEEKKGTGEKFNFDDFYHADSGTWELETVIHLLKKQKYVSSKAELQAFLVYEAQPGEIVRIKQAEQRWKLIEVLKNKKIMATGWVDAHRKAAEKLPDE